MRPRVSYGLTFTFRLFHVLTAVRSNASFSFMFVLGVYNVYSCSRITIPGVSSQELARKEGGSVRAQSDF